MNIQVRTGLRDYRQGNHFHPFISFRISDYRPTNQPIERLSSLLTLKIEPYNAESRTPFRLQTYFQSASPVSGQRQERKSKAEKEIKFSGQRFSLSLLLLIGTTTTPPSPPISQTPFLTLLRCIQRSGHHSLPALKSIACRRAPRNV